MSDAWADAQQRAHNLASFRGMTVPWRKPYRSSGKRPQFTDTQMRIALAVHDKNMKESNT